MIRPTIAILAASLPLCVALSGCKQGSKESGGQAAGTILPGSTSDAMIPLDSVRSEPPLAPAGSAEGGAKKDGAKARSSDKPAKDAAPDEAEADPTPTATPTPETAAT